MSSRGRARLGALQEVRAWSLRDVEQALRRNRLPECADACRKRDIDGSTLLDLSESSLILWKRDLSVVNTRKLAAFIHELKNEPEKYIVNSNEVKSALAPVPLESPSSSTIERKGAHSLKGLLPIHTKSSSSSENDAWDTDFDDEEDDDKNRKFQVGKSIHEERNTSSNIANRKKSHLFEDNKMIGVHNKTECHSPPVANRIPNKIKVPAAFSVNFDSNLPMMTANQNVASIEGIQQRTSTSNSKPSVPLRPPGLTTRITRTISNTSELPKPPLFHKDEKLTLEDIIRKIPDDQDYEDDLHYGSLDGEILIDMKSELDVLNHRSSVQKRDVQKQVDQDLPKWDPKRFSPGVEFLHRKNSSQLPSVSTPGPRPPPVKLPFHIMKTDETEAPRVPPLPARPLALAQQKLLSTELHQTCDDEENYEKIEYSDEEQYESIPHNGLGTSAQWSAASPAPPAVSDGSEYYLQPVQPPAASPTPSSTPTHSPTPTATPPLLPPKPRALLQPPPPPPGEATIKGNLNEVPNKDNLWLRFQKNKEQENNSLNVTDDREKSLQDVKRNNIQVSRSSPNSETKGGVTAGRPLPAPPSQSEGSPKASRVVTRRPSIKIPLVQMPWYFNVDRRSAEEILKNAEDGTYLLRPSTQTQHPLTLTLKFGSRVFNICVRHRPDGKYALGTAKSTEQSFSSVEELVQFYTTSELILFSNGENAGAVVLVSSPRK